MVSSMRLLKNVLNDKPFTLKAWFAHPEQSFETHGEPFSAYP